MKQPYGIRLLLARLMLLATMATAAFANDAIQSVPDSLLLVSPQYSNEEICGIDQPHWKGNSRASPDDPFIVSTWFQGGSGRYWQIAIRNPQNLGVCLTTSTIGFRSLQQFADLPLPWSRDFDEDGVNEIIYWYSFALGQSIEAGYGLSARVYRRQSDSRLIANPAFTNQMVKQIMAAYRMPISGASEFLQQQRENALQLLKAQLSAN